MRKINWPVLFRALLHAVAWLTVFAACLIFWDWLISKVL